MTVSADEDDFMAEGPASGEGDLFRTIRYNKNTKLENQQQALALLDAVEAALKEKQLEYTAENYFLAMWPIFDNEAKEGEVAKGKGQVEKFNNSIAYLLSFVFPHLPRSFIKANYSQIYASLGHGIERFQHIAPFVRASLACVGSVFRSFDLSEWRDRPSLLELFGSVLKFCVDLRPKVRKLAHEIAYRCMSGGNDTCLGVASQYMKMVIQGATRKECGQVLHLCPLLRGSLKLFDQSNLDNLIGPLMNCANLGNSLLSVAVFDLFRELASANDQLRVRLNQSQIRKMIDGFIRHKPDFNLSELACSWLPAFVSLLVLDLSMMKGEILGMVFDGVTSEHEKVHLACQNALAQIPDSFTETTIFLDQVEKRLSVSSLGYILAIFRDFIIRHPATHLPEGLIKKLADLYPRKKEFQTDIGKAIGECIKLYGPKLVLSLIPLNLEGSAAEGPSRAWLLPILKDFIFNTELSYFIEYFIPLADRMTNKSDVFSKAGKSTDAKVYSTVVFQIWSLMPSFLVFPVDFSPAFTVLAPRLGELMNSDPLLRSVIANGLTQFIQRSTTMEDDIATHSITLFRSVVNNGLETLGEFSPQLLPLLFNLYGATEHGQRAYLSRLIGAILGISKVELVKEYMAKVLLRIPKSKSSEIVSFLELACLMVGFLGEEEHTSLFHVVVSLIGSSEDITVQKRSHKALIQIFSHELWGQSIFPLHCDQLEQVLTSKVSQDKKGRLRLLFKVSSLLRDEDLYWIPLFLPEAILGTKEINQKSRSSAFDLLVSWARRMSLGGKIIAKKTNGILEIDAEASLDEFMMMVIAGLAGKTPHMISATLMGLARIVYELGDVIDSELIQVLLGDIIHLLGSPSKEVIKSAFGFIKVSIIILPIDSLKPHLSLLIEGILGWSKEHSLHFKVRVRHLIERLIRRFGFDLVHSLTPLEHQKLTINIRKRKERLRRRKSQSPESNHEKEDIDMDMEAMTDAALSRSSLLINKKNGFEKVLYHSESELEDEDEEAFDLAEMANLDDADLETTLTRKLSLHSKTIMKNARNTTNSQSVKNTRNLKNPAPVNNEFMTSSDGKFIIKDSDDDSGAADGDDGGILFDPSVHAVYEKALPTGKKQVRFSNTSKKRSFENEKDDELGLSSFKSVRSMATGLSKVTTKTATTKHSGLEFKGRKGASGDVRLKKAKFEPYAYVPLARKTNKNGKRNRYFMQTKK